jgi:hypothetical protein
MRPFLLALLGLAVTCATAPAGPNFNGAIVVHTNDAYEYLSTTICTTPLGNPAACEAAITRTDKGSAAVVWLLASFPPNAIPRVAAVYFGVAFDETNLSTEGRYGPCGPEGTIELPDAGWPGNASGNSVGFGTPVLGDTCFPFYFFVIDDGSGGPPASPTFCSAINPTGGYAAFYDTSFPPVRDEITRFGCVRWYGEGHNDCPGSLPESPCCNATTGACSLTPEGSCFPPAVWHPDWQDCSPCPQPPPLGACCNPSTGACTLTLQASCPPPKIWHPEWTSCSPNPCPQMGACCNPSTGACTLTMEANCAPPKIWHHEWTSCSPNPCPQPPQGACCNPSTGACSMTIEGNCASPRIWHPEWTSCSPNPCPQPPQGACCNPSTGGCTITPEATCPLPWIWHGDWTSCTPNPCPQPPTAVCCNPATGACTITTQAACSYPSVWHADWTSCTPNPCPPVRACCDLDGSCALTLESNCMPPRVWHSAWTSCTPNPCGQPPTGPNANGALIVHTNDAYSYLSTTICDTDLGQPLSCEAAITRTDKQAGAVVWLLASFYPGASPSVASVYFGINFDMEHLDPSLALGPCGPAGTVELPDAGWPATGAGNTVAFGTPVAGNTLFRFYFFKVDETGGGVPGPFLCTTDNPTGGYAAFYDGSFPPIEDRVTRFGCVRWYDIGFNACPAGGSPGVCCNPVTYACAVTLVIDCQPPAVWHAEWTSCDPNPCLPPIQGVCCSPDGWCWIAPAQECLPPYVWYPEWTSCDPNPCPQPPPPGSAACCAPDGSCTLTLQEDCLPPSWWLPWAHECTGGVCSPPTRTEQTSWGKIKAIFR